MINPAPFMVPAMVANQTIRRQQSNTHGTYLGPLPDKVDRKARKRYVEYYVDELRKEGFEVLTWADVIDDRTIIEARKGNIAYRTSVGNVYFMDDLWLANEIRDLVRNVENAIAEKEKEKIND